MSIDIEKLNAGLQKLTGLDFEEAESAERAAGNNFPLISFSSSFQARLAAKALEINVHDLKEMPLRDYDAATRATFNFLFNVDSASETA